jgi:hypothetical protein
MSQAIPPRPGRANLILGLGIASLVTACCGCPGVILGPVAWILGQHDLKRIAAGQIAETAKQPTQIGVNCAMGGTILSALALIALCLWQMSERLLTNK